MNDGARRTGFDGLRAVVRRRGGLALAVFSWTFAGVLGLVTGLPNLYRASATVLVERPVDPTAAPGEVEARLHQIGQSVLSRSRLVELIQGFGLYAKVRPEASEDAVVERMRRDVVVEPKGADSTVVGRTTTAFTVNYRGPDPDVAAGVANAIAGLYVEADRLDQARTVDTLGAQLEEARRRLELEERRQAAFQDRHWGELPQQAEANRAAAERLAAQIRAASDARRRAVERRADLVRQIGGAEWNSAGESVDGAARIRRELAELRKRFTEKHPDVRRKQAELAAAGETSADARQEAAGNGGPQEGSPVPRLQEELRQAEEEIQGLQRQEESYRRESLLYERRIENAPRHARAFDEATRDYQATRSLYEALLKRYEEAQLTAGAGETTPGRFRLLEPALPPSHPVAPHRPRLLLLGLVASLALAAGAAVLAEQADATFHSVEELRGFTRVLVLTSLPTIARDRRRRWRRALAASLVLVVLIGIGRASYRYARGNEDIVALLSRGRP